MSGQQKRYTEKGELYFVAKRGMMVEAVIMPSVPDRKELLEQLGRITAQLAAQVDTEDTLAEPNA